MNEAPTYQTGTGQTLTVHPEAPACLRGCPIHAPTPHPLSCWPTRWRDDRSLMERICPHGIGHPDPDHLAHTARVRGVGAASAESVHGCDGCCRGGGLPA